MGAILTKADILRGLALLNERDQQKRTSKARPFLA
jgi:hypothetical protein